MYTLLPTLVLLKIVTGATATGIVTNAYTWRDYDGTIPTDAFVAGLDKDNQNVYIGQALFESWLMPGELHDGAISFEYYGKVLGVSKDIKLLCTSEPYKFEWIKTTYNEGLPERKIVFAAGDAPHVTTHFGRLNEDGAVSVGKVLCLNTKSCGLYSTKNGTAMLHTVFEFLTYNPNAAPVFTVGKHKGPCKQVSINVFNDD